MAIHLLASYELIDKDGNPGGDEPPEQLGVYPVLAWEPESNTSFDDCPQGNAVLLIPRRYDRLGSHPGPVSTVG